MKKADEIKNIVNEHKDTMMKALLDNLKAAQIAAAEIGVFSLYVNVGRANNISICFNEKDFPFDKETATREDNGDASDRLVVSIDSGINLYCFVSKEA